MARHKVQKGETPQSIARSYTGNESRYRDLLAVNPNLGQVTGQMGAPEVDPRDWKAGMAVQIPDRWMREEGMLGAPMLRQAKRPLGVKLKKPGIPIKGPWDQMHPQWPGSYLSYWSKRIEDTIVSGANEHMGQFAQCAHLIKYGNGRARLLDWLRSYATPQEFYEAFEGQLEFPTAIPAHIWFAHPWDGQVTRNAAWEFVNGHCG